MSESGPELNHAMIYVTDAARSLKFYRDALGWLVIEEMDGYARLRSPRGESTIGLHEVAPEQTLDPTTEGMRLYFEVPELDAFCARLASEGVAFEQMPQDMEWGWRHAYLRDPDGHQISLYWAGPKRFQPSTAEPTTSRTRARGRPRSR